MEFIPRYLAQKFSFFESISIPKFFLLFFSAFFITAFISMQLGEHVVNILAPILVSLIFICFASFVSVQHFSRKPWVPTSPLIVQFTSQAWFNSLLTILSIIRHWSVLTFVNIAVVMVLVINVVAIIQAFGS
ncbi:hypothetical protein I6F48_07110 [Pseudoalteromonas sp. SWYJ118]|uniref:hypothetical protein n=1 Tax=Pseudoalteromonas sp. SWYJ118 TaxID=2792062 RepID=UPI0018CD95D5|nr:hypothetical protein [Pseudoalteromonas sp. SWYJ118]MBH0075341.1 hypothetical protein [Pseudoalteromonas sp. SWYJ118]